MSEGDQRKSNAWGEADGEKPDADAESKKSGDEKKKKEADEKKKKEADEKRNKEEEEAKKLKYPKRLPGDPKRAIFKCDIGDGEQTEDQEEEDAHQNPAFYLACATVIGMFCFCTFMFAFILGYGEFRGLPIWLGTFIGGFLCFIVPFFYYWCTSHHPSCCGRFGDGFLGAWPFILPGTGMFFLYAVCGIAVKNVRGGPLTDKILIYACVPLYMLLWLPCFVGLMYLQGNEIEAEKKEKEAELAAHGKRSRKQGIDLGRGRWKLSFTVFRRLVIATVVSCCVTSYAILPVFGFCWCIIGMMILWYIHWAIPIGILVFFICVIVIMAVCCPKALKQVGYFFRGYYKMPLAGWAPRTTGSVLPKYDNSLSLDRRLDAHNVKIDRMEKLRMAGPEKAQECEQLIQEIRIDRNKLQSLGADVVDEIIVVEKEEPKKKKEEPKQTDSTRKPAGGQGRGETHAVDVESM